MNPQGSFNEGWNHGTGQFNDASLEAFLQSIEHEESNPFFDHNRQGSIAANGPPQPAQEQVQSLKHEESNPFSDHNRQGSIAANGPPQPAQEQVQSFQHQELNHFSAHDIQGSVAANDPPQLTQEQGFQAETASFRQRKGKGDELTPDPKKEKQRLQKQKSREKLKKMKEALEREFTLLKDQVETQMEETASVKQQNASLVQATESQEKTVKKLKKRAAKWKLEYQKEHDRAEYLQNQMPSLISKLIDDKFNHLFKLLGAASASDVDQALYAQAIPSRQQNVAASHAQMNSPMVGMSNTDPFQPNSQSGALPSSMQQSPANMEGSFKFK